MVPRRFGISTSPEADCERRSTLPHILLSHVNVELDAAPLQDFIAGTNAVIAPQHGVAYPKKR